MKLQLYQIKWIKIFAPLTFGVYLIHLQPMVAVHILQGKFALLAFEPPWILVIKVIFVSLVIYLCCSMIEWGRQKLLFAESRDLGGKIKWCSTKIYIF